MNSIYEECMKTKNYQPFRMGYLTDWMVEKAKSELNETDNNRELAIKEMKNLIAEKGLKCWTDDNYLLQYLRARKFNVTRAFTLLKNFFQVKKEYPEVYGKFHYDFLKSYFELGSCGCLPYRDEDGCVVILFKLALWDPDVHPMPSVITGMTMLILFCVEDPATQVCGVRLLLDVKDTSLKQIKCITSFRHIQLLGKGLRNSLPIRFKGIHVYNESSIFQYVGSVLKLLMSEKIKKRFHFHGDNSKHLQKYIPKAILPTEYEGDNYHYLEREWCRKELEAFYAKYDDLHLQGYV